jgi:signal transduction histidine kinase
VSFASHEFRTPLTTILSSISLVEIYLNQAPSEKTTKHIERIKSSIKHLTDILNDFLSLDKLEQGKIEIENQEQDLKELIDETVEDIKQIMKAGQQVHFNHTGPAEIFHDSKILRNVLINLLSNAIKYSPEGNAVYIESEVSNGLVTIHVKDSGIGIPEDEQKHLFQKFYRASNASSMQGTGLGLNIVQRYVELMGGQIGFTSKSGVGTVFTVQFRQNHH